MRTVELTCGEQKCWARRLYAATEVRVSLYTHGVCTVTFRCRRCHCESEFAVPDRVALDLDSMGSVTTVVHTPEEVLEWPARGTPAVQPHEVGLVERSTLDHFNDCARRELLA